MLKTIAIVDDDEAVRDSLCALLSSAGYRTRAYATCSEFLHAARMSRIDAVILDHQMCGMTGVELAEQLAYEKLVIGMVMVSGNVTSAVRTRAKNAGVEVILEKPFSDEQILRVIEAQLGDTRP